MMIGGGEHPGSTRIDESTRCPLSRRSSGTSKMPTRLAFAEHEPTLKAWRGVGEVESLTPCQRSAGGANRAQKDRIKRGINRLGFLYSNGAS